MLFISRSVARMSASNWLTSFCCFLICAVRAESFRVVPQPGAAAAAFFKPVAVIGIAAFTRIGKFTVEGVDKWYLFLPKVFKKGLEVQKIRMGLMEMDDIRLKTLNIVNQPPGGKG